MRDSIPGCRGDCMQGDKPCPTPDECGSGTKIGGAVSWVGSLLIAIALAGALWSCVANGGRVMP